MTIPTNHTERERQVLDWIERLIGDAAKQQRDEFDSLAESDPDLHARVLAMLEPAGDASSILNTGGAWLHHNDDLRPPSIAGYRILRELGQGGMGTVYLGTRESDDFELEVAIKVVRDRAHSERLVERLREERRTMTLLQHPNIAQIFDGGETEEGHPYLVMEYVEGVSLSRYIDEHEVSQTQRLTMFLQICSAITYSHQHLIIHRDLSPSNILVTNDGFVKVIDFGLAHNLDKESVEDGQSSYLTITEGYGAPERALGVAATTTTDIYSLGAVLSDLCKGLIFSREVDLQAIAAKAMSVDPDSRYPSVDALVADVKAYQDIRPVSACSTGFSYTAARFIRRHRSSVLVFGGVFLGLIAGGIILTNLYLRAVEAEQQANSQFNQVRKIATLLMFDVFDSVVDLDGSLPAQQLLIETSLTYLGELDAASSDPALSLEVAQGYKRLSDVTGNPNYANLGLRGEASELLQRAVEIIRTPDVRNPSDPNYLRVYIEVINAQAAQLAFSEGAFEEAYNLLLTAKDAAEQLGTVGLLTVDDGLVDARMHSLLGYLQGFFGNPAKAIEHTSQGAEAFRALSLEYPTNTKVQRMLYGSQSELAEMYARQAHDGDGDYSKALELFDAATAGFRGLLTKAGPMRKVQTNYLIALTKQSKTQCRVDGLRDHALKNLQTAEEMVVAALVIEPEDVSKQNRLTTIMSHQAECLYLNGQVESSIRLWKEVTKQDQRRLQENPQNPGYLKAMINGLWAFSEVYVEAGDLESACQLGRQLEQAWSIYQQPGVTISDLDHKAIDHNRKLLDRCSKVPIAKH